jgi:hypothetical protein
MGEAGQVDFAVRKREKERESERSNYSKRGFLKVR